MPDIFLFSHKREKLCHFIRQKSVGIAEAVTCYCIFSFFSFPRCFLTLSDLQGQHWRLTVQQQHKERSWSQRKALQKAEFCKF